jgi:hypothetical protein
LAHCQRRSGRWPRFRRVPDHSRDRHQLAGWDGASMAQGCLPATPFRRWCVGRDQQGSLVRMRPLLCERAGFRGCQ